jgi:hypothetical protein
MAAGGLPAVAAPPFDRGLAGFVAGKPPGHSRVTSACGRPRPFHRSKNAYTASHGGKSTGRPPLDAVLDHVRDGIAHRPQVMDHRAPHGDGQPGHHLPGPQLQHGPLGIVQVRRIARPTVTAPAARRDAGGGKPGRDRVNLHVGPWRYGRLPLGYQGAHSHPAAPRRTATESRRSRRLRPSGSFIYRLLRDGVTDGRSRRGSSCPRWRSSRPRRAAARGSPCCRRCRSQRGQGSRRRPGRLASTGCG